MKRWWHRLYRKLFYHITEEELKGCMMFLSLQRLASAGIEEVSILDKDYCNLCDYLKLELRLNYDGAPKDFICGIEIKVI